MRVNNSEILSDYVALGIFVNGGNNTTLQNDGFYPLAWWEDEKVIMQESLTKEFKAMIMDELGFTK